MSERSVEPCVFCEIVAGNEPASVVHRDERLIAFLDIEPVNLGHLLVVPIAHSPTFGDVDEATVAAMFVLGQRLGAALRGALGCPGVRYVLADGAAAGQDVFHTHLHVVPRYPNDGFQIRAAWTRPPRETLDQTAALIRGAFSSTSRI